MKLKFAGMLKGSLRGRLIICMLIVSLIPLLLADFVMYKGYIGIMHENVEKLTNANLKQTRTALDTWIDSYGDVIAQLYYNQDVKNNLQMYYEYNDETALESLDKEMSYLLYIKDYIMAITIITENGDSFFHDRITPFSSHSFWINHYSLSMSEIYDMTIKNNDTTYFSTQYAKTIPAKKYYLFHMAHALTYRCNGEEKQAVVIVSIDEQLLENVCNSAANNSDENMNFIVDSNGYVVSYTDSSYLSQQIDIEGLGESEKSDRYREFVKNTGVMGSEDIRVQYIQDETLEWDVINVSINDVYKSEVEKMQESVLTIALLVAFLTLVMIGFTIKYFMKNIDVVVDSMNKVEKGNADVRISGAEKMPREIATIAENLNRMLDKLEDSMESEKLMAERERVAEIAALEARINPHFLYNTLDTINWMAIEKNEIEISNAISALGKILRYGINDSNAVVTIRTEMEWLEQYIHLQQARLKDTFEFNVSVEPDVLDYKIHKLLLQPFVENSIIHGFAKKRGKHILSITIKQSDMLEISIVDNGGGMSEEQVEMINSGQFRHYDDKYHIGMENAFQRIKLYYGEEACVNVISESGQSTTVYIRLPKDEV